MPAVITPTLRRITDAEILSTGTAAWGALGGGAAGMVLETDFFIQGSFCISKAVSGATGTIKGMWWDNTATGTHDLSGGDHLYIWIFNGTPGVCLVRRLGGVRIRLGTTTANYADWFVDGNDTLLRGGWKRYVLDPRKAPSEIGGAGVTLSSIRYFGALFATGGTVKAANLGIDAIDVGRGLKVWGTADNGWQDILDADMGTPRNRYGIVQEDSGIIFARGEIVFGDGSGTALLDFRDTNRVVVWEDFQYNSGTVSMRAISDQLYKLEVVGNSSASGTFTDGIKVGTGDTARGRAGSLFRTAGPSIQAGVWHSEIDVLLLYGTNFRGFDGGLRFGLNTAHEFMGGTVDQSGQINPASVAMRNVNFVSTVHEAYSGSALLWNANIDVKNSNFIAHTHASANPHGIEHPQATTGSYEGLIFIGNDYDIEFSAPSGDLLVNAIEGSNPLTYEITGGGSSVTINTPVTFELTGLQTDSEVRIYTDLGGGEAGTELTGVESSGATFEYLYSYGGDQAIVVVIFHMDYLPLRLFLTLTIDDQSVPVQQNVDRVYENL